MLKRRIADLLSIRQSCLQMLEHEAKVVKLNQVIKKGKDSFNLLSENVKGGMEKGGPMEESMVIVLKWYLSLLDAWFALRDC